MKKFTVGALCTISIYTIVEAESEAEALQTAESRSTQTFCHQCAGNDDIAEVLWAISGELDGNPENLVVYDVSD